jgi:hypothetical protein
VELETEKARTSHDEWSKDALAFLLKHIGEVQLDARIAGNSRRGDVLFTEKKKKKRKRKWLGLLGELARGEVLFEAFRNPVTPWEIMTCLVKTIEHTAQKHRAARRAKQPLSTVEPTALCVITTRASQEFKKAAGLTLISQDKPGLYTMAPMLRTAIIVVDELVGRDATRWLGLLGRDEVQNKALSELLDEKLESIVAENARIQLLIAWHRHFPQANLTNLKEEEAMNIRETYQQFKREMMDQGRAEGKLEGKAEGKAEAVLVILKGRGLSVTAAQRKQILHCKDDTQLDAWLLGAAAVHEVKELLSVPAKRRTPRRAA